MKSYRQREKPTLENAPAQPTTPKKRTRAQRKYTGPGRRDHLASRWQLGARRSHVTGNEVVP